MTQALVCGHCAAPALPADRFCGGCGQPRATAPSLSVQVDEVFGDPSLTTAPVALTDLRQAAGLSSPPDGPTTPAPGDTTPPAVPPESADGEDRSADRGLIAEVAQELRADWKASSGTEKAAGLAVGLYNGVATLWNVGLVLAGILAVCFWLFTSCSGTASVSASTTCDQWMQMDQQTRYDGAEALGRKAKGSTFKGPMAGLNVDYSCSYASGSRTIGSIMGVK